MRHTLRKLRLKYEDTITQTEKAILFLIRGEEYWIPKWSFKWCYSGRYILVNENILEEKNLLAFAKPYQHIPEKMEIKYEQQAIDELRFNSDECS